MTTSVAGLAFRVDLRLQLLHPVQKRCGGECWPVRWCDHDRFRHPLGEMLTIIQDEDRLHDDLEQTQSAQDNLTEPVLTMPSASRAIIVSFADPAVASNQSLQS